eukprot:14499273-Alexandrium_andersonii.AAC.1
MEANSLPQRPFGALSGLPHDRRRTMGESALTGQLVAPLRGDPSCYVENIFAHSTAPVGRWPRESSERILRRGTGLPPGRLAHR